MTKTAKLLLGKQESLMKQRERQDWKEPHSGFSRKTDFSPWLVTQMLLQLSLSWVLSVPTCEWTQQSSVCSFMSWCSLRLCRGRGPVIRSLYSLKLKGADKRGWADFGLWPGTATPSFLLEHHRKWWLVQTPGSTRSPALIMGKLNKRHPLLTCPPIPEMIMLWQRKRLLLILSSFTYQSSSR